MLITSPFLIFKMGMIQQYFPNLIKKVPSFANKPNVFQIMPSYIVWRCRLQQRSVNMALLCVDRSRIGTRLLNVWVRVMNRRSGG